MNTRNSNMRYIIPLPSNRYGENTIKVKCPQIWNGLNTDIKEIDKLKTFREKLKEFYLNSYLL